MTALTTKYMYCKTGKFHDMKISQIWAVDNFVNKYSREGKFHESRDIHTIHENFLHTNICCSTVVVKYNCDVTF